MIHTGFPNVQDKGRIIAHRGASQIAPENTLAAFRAAFEQGANWVEFDVSRLGDNTPVIHHDSTLGRCTTSTASLREIKKSDLVRIGAGKLHAKEFANEAIPTLQQTLDLLEANGMYANLEIKTHDDPPGVLAKSVCTALAERSWASERVIVSSFDHEELAAFRSMMPECAVAALWTRPPLDFRKTLTELRASAVHLKYSHLSQSFLQEATSYGFDVRVYTVNRPAVMAPFRDLGLTSIITDHPPLFLDDPDWKTWAES